jgi:hypothetical protein
MELAIENERMLERGIAVFDMFRGVDLRRTLVSVGAVSVQAACGVMFMLGECLPFTRTTAHSNMQHMERISLKWPMLETHS